LNADPLKLGETTDIVSQEVPCGKLSTVARHRHASIRISIIGNLNLNNQLITRHGQLFLTIRAQALANAPANSAQADHAIPAVDNLVHPKIVSQAALKVRKPSWALVLARVWTHYLVYGNLFYR